MNPVLVALDFDDSARAHSIATALQPHVGGFKVGLELIMSSGPSVISEIADLGLPVFADVKLHDIPNTVRAAARQVGSHGARWLTVHAVGGRSMIEAAIDGMSSSRPGDPNGVLAVTVLTSLGREDLEDIGMSGKVEEVAASLAVLAGDSGAEGVICSPHELGAIRRARPSLVRVTPGIRPPGADSQDQKRVTTPEEALASGADWLVIGRAITASADPVAEAERLAGSLAAIA